MIIVPFEREFLRASVPIYPSMNHLPVTNNRPHFPSNEFLQNSIERYCIGGGGWGALEVHYWAC